MTIKFTVLIFNTESQSVRVTPNYFSKFQNSWLKIQVFFHCPLSAIFVLGLEKLLISDEQLLALYRICIQ